MKAPFNNEESQEGDKITNREGSTNTSFIISNALIINASQLLVSIVYVTYNSLLTRMLSFNEDSRFAAQRHTVCVSRPAGEQRSPYYLQVPYRYSIPLLISIALLHWLISRGSYLINIRVDDLSSMEIPDRTRYSRGMSPLPLLLAFFLGTKMWIVLFVLKGKHLGRGMPSIGTCSVAISAACHPPTWESADATKGLMYGVVSQELRDHQESVVAFLSGEHTAGAGDVSFSSGNVQPLVVNSVHSKDCGE
jgi:hypothetical protein